VVGEHPVDRREHARDVLVQVHETVRAWHHRERDVRHVDRHRGGAAGGVVGELA